MHGWAGLVVELAVRVLDVRGADVHEDYGAGAVVDLRCLEAHFCGGGGV